MFWENQTWFLKIYFFFSRDLPEKKFVQPVWGPGVNMIWRLKTFSPPLRYPPRRWWRQKSWCHSILLKKTTLRCENQGFQSTQTLYFLYNKNSDHYEFWESFGFHLHIFYFVAYSFNHLFSKKCVLSLLRVLLVSLLATCEDASCVVIVSNIKRAATERVAQAAFCSTSWCSNSICCKRQNLHVGVDLN